MSISILFHASMECMMKCGSSNCSYVEGLEPILCKKNIIYFLYYIISWKMMAFWLIIIYESLNCLIYCFFSPRSKGEATLNFQSRWLVPWHFVNNMAANTNSIWYFNRRTIMINRYIFKDQNDFKCIERLSKLHYWISIN